MASAVSTASAGKLEPAWPTFRPAKPDPVLGNKAMSPEQTLIEFISTSAGLHGVSKQSLRSLEWDILKVFPYNIMPANAAAWYMAKRKYYSDQPPEQQLLPFLLKKYPDKFKVNKFQVEYLESYSKETAKRKLNYLVQYGLDAYFSHKVDEYGVYFFDPHYYEMTEPFHESLRIAGKGSKSRLVAGYFSQMKHRYVYTSHTNTLASLSKIPGPKIMTNTTGVIVSMVNNQFGFLKFGSGEKAIFCAKALFRDGWQYSGDPLRLPAMYFDAYQVPAGIKTGAESCKWFAVLVWCGRKPAPKFNSSLADFNQASGSSALLRPGSPPAAAAPIGEGRKLRQPSSSMMIGQVVSIRKNGAVISVRDDSEEKVFVPGWSKENSARSGTWLTTLTGDTIGMRDLVAYYVASDETMPGFTAVGKNVMVLKEHQEVLSTKKQARRSRMSVELSGGAKYEASDNESQYQTEVSESEDSLDDSVSDSELEWLENDLEEIIEEDGPDAKTHPLFLKLKNTIKDVRASVEKKGRAGKRDGRDSGMGSHPTTPRSPTKSPRSNQKLKIGKRTEGAEAGFWRTKAAFASINSDYRSSDDEEYEIGDEIITIEGNEKERPRRRLTSSMSSTSAASSRRNQRRRSEVSENESRAGDRTERKNSLPYWVRALTLPEEYDETTGKFLPVDKNYNEQRDPDYAPPFDEEDFDEDDFEDEEQDAKGDGNAEDPAKKADDDSKEDKESEQAGLTVKEELVEEMKLLLKEATEEIPEDILEGRHKKGPKRDSPEKIVVTKPEEDKEEIAEVITIDEPASEHEEIWLPNAYTTFLDRIQGEDYEDDVGSNVDPEYVPPSIIIDSDLDYDEYEEEELKDELTGLEDELKTDLSKAANYIAIWVPVDSVRERKERAEAEQKEREEMLKAAQELEALKAKEKEEAEKEKEQKEGNSEGGKTDQSKTKRTDSMDGKVTRAKVGSKGSPGKDAKTAEVGSPQKKPTTAADTASTSKVAAAN